MSLAEYTRIQRREAKVSKRNLEKYLENAEGILSPQEIEDANKANIEGITKAEIETGKTKDQATALSEATTELRNSINELTNNDEDVTSFVIAGLDEDQLMALNQVYDEFISNYLLKYGKTQKSKEFFIQSAKAFLLKNYQDFKPYTNFGITTAQEQIVKTAQAKAEQAKLDEAKRNQDEIDRIDADRKTDEAQAQADLIASQAQQTAQLLADQKAQSQEYDDLLVNEYIPKEQQKFDDLVAEKVAKLTPLNDDIPQLQQLVKDYEDSKDELNTLNTSKKQKNVIDKAKVDQLYDIMTVANLNTFINEIDEDVDTEDKKIFKKRQDQLDWLNANFFHLLPVAVAEAFVNNVIADIPNQTFIQVVKPKAKKLQGKDFITNIDLEKYNIEIGVNLLDMIKNAQTPYQAKLTKLEQETLNILDNAQAVAKEVTETDVNAFNRKMMTEAIYFDNTYTKKGMDLSNQDEYYKFKNKRDVQRFALLELSPDFMKAIEASLQTVVSKEFSSYMQYLITKHKQGQIVMDDVINELKTSKIISGTGLKTTINKRISKAQQSTKRAVNETNILNDISHPILYIDKKLLNKNMLSLKYKKNGNTHPKFKTVYISDDLKKAILTNNHKMELEPREKQILKNLTLLVGTEEEKTPYKSDNEFDKKFKILLGELRAGNDSKILKTELKKYILAGLQENKLSRSVALDLMLELSS